MTVYYDEGELQTRLLEMDHKRLVLFGLFVAERLLPNYAVFSREQSFGDVGGLRAALDLVWQWLEGMQFSDDEIESQIEDCETITPDTEQFSSLYVSAALDAASATVNVLRMLQNSDGELAVENGTFGRDTVDLYVQEIERMPANSADLEERIRVHPLMQSEINSQFEAVREIESGISISEAKRKWKSVERSNLDLT